MVGTDSNGLIVAYTYGATPSGVTPIGVQVPLDVPLFIDLPAYGTLSVAGSQVSVVEVSGNLNVLSANSTGALHIEADGAVTTLPTQLGTLSNFNSNGTGWTITSTGSFTATVDSDVLQLTKSGIDYNANAIWFDTPQALAYGFVANFTYTGLRTGPMESPSWCRTPRPGPPPSEASVAGWAMRGLATAWRWASTSSRTVWPWDSMGPWGPWKRRGPIFPWEIPSR